MIEQTEASAVTDIGAALVLMALFVGGVAAMIWYGVRDYRTLKKALK